MLILSYTKVTIGRGDFNNCDIIRRKKMLNQNNVSSSEKIYFKHSFGFSNNTSLLKNVHAVQLKHKIQKNAIL